VGQRGLPLDEDDVAVPQLPDHPLDDSGREVGGHPVDDHAPVGADHDAGLAGRDPGGVQPGVPGRPVELVRGRPLADGAVGPHHENHVGVDVDLAVRHPKVLPVGRLADVDEIDAVFVGERPPPGLLAQQDVQPRDDVAAGGHRRPDVGRPLRREVAAGGRDPEDERLRRRGGFESGGDRLDDGHVGRRRARDHVAGRRPGVPRVDDGVSVEQFRVHDDSVRGLAVGRPEGSLREDHDRNGRLVLRPQAHTPLPPRTRAKPPYPAC
jgi:hypothetical protein